MTARSAAPRRKKPERRPECFIVGAGPGIGAPLAEAFAGEGYDIALLPRGTAKLREQGAALSRTTGAKVCASPATARDQASHHAGRAVAHPHIGQPQDQITPDPGLHTREHPPESTP